MNQKLTERKRLFKNISIKMIFNAIDTYSSDMTELIQRHCFEENKYCRLWPNFLHLKVSARCFDIFRLKIASFHLVFNIRIAYNK